MKAEMGWGVALAVVMGVGGSVAYYLHDRSACEQAALPYVKEAVPVLALWNVQVTKSYLAPAEVTGTSDEAVAQSVSDMSRLGHLQSAGEPKLTDLSYGVNSSLGIYHLATYELPARFDAAAGTVKIRILDEDGKFSVFAFHVTTLAAAGTPGSTLTSLSEYHAAHK